MLLEDSARRDARLLVDLGAGGAPSARELRLPDRVQSAPMVAPLHPNSVTVEDAMSTQVYAAKPDTTLDEVAETLAEHKYGSAVAIDNGKVVGIVTTNDACRALVEFLRSR